MSGAYEHVSLEVVDRVGWLRFDRPPINAISWDMLTEKREG